MGKSETEEKILVAARAEFLSQGYNGTRMRAIAERAGINKGLLHYYFKSKDALLTHVFQETFGELFEALTSALSSEKNLFKQIEKTVSIYTDFMIRHAELPTFINQELSRRGPMHVVNLKKAGRPSPLKTIAESVVEAKKKGLIKDEVEPGELILNMISMILHPIEAKRVVMYMHQINETEYRQMLEKRKTTITEFIINAIKA